MAMLRLIISISVFWWSFSAADGAQIGLLKVGERGAQVAYEAQIFDATQTTLVLMPGIYRGLSSRTEDQLLQDLTKQKINWVAFHFSTHPESIIQSGQQEVRIESIKDLSREAKDLVLHLGLQKPLVISLSYSSAVASLFTSEDLSVIVDTAPIGRQDDSSDGMWGMIEANNSYCALFLNQWLPYCMGWESQKQLFYNTFWTQKALSLVSVYPELQELSVLTSAVQGYVSMARAVENYDYSEVSFALGPQRIFILGENESSQRLEIQLAAIKEYSQQKETPYVFVIEGAGHVVPTDQPLAYLKTLQMILNQTLPPIPGFYKVSTTGAIAPLNHDSH